tara:strand:- start:5868 stop:6701 length:834 start_codon:yes stop_codon:yes gene_type:complete
VPDPSGSVFTEASDLVLSLFLSIGLATVGVLFFAVGSLVVVACGKPRALEFQRTWLGIDVLMSIAVYISGLVLLGIAWAYFGSLGSLEQALPALAVTAGTGALVAAFLLFRARELSLDLGWFGFGGGDHVRSVALGALTYVFGLPLLIGLMGIWNVALTSLGVTEGQDVAVMIESASRDDLLPIALLAAIVIPWVEELYFRGALFSWLHKVGGAKVAVLVSSVLFAAIHGFVASGPIFVLALMLAFARIHSRGILACFVIHAMHNGLQVAVLHFLKP